MPWSIILISAIFWGIVADVIATYRGTDPNLGLLAGFLFGPIGIIIAFVLPKKEKEKRVSCVLIVVDIMKGVFLFAQIVGFR